jgi:hypothetical protein
MELEFGTAVDRLQADDRRVYAWLRTPSFRRLQGINRWLIYEHSNGGCERFPAVTADKQAIFFYNSKHRDPFEQLDTDTLRTGVKRCLRRARLGDLIPAADMWVMVIELASFQQDKWNLSINNLRRLDCFHRYILNSHRVQTHHLQLVQLTEHRATLVASHNPITLSHIRDFLIDLHHETEICLGLSKGEIYYISEQQIVSDAFNRLSLGFRNLKSGSVIFDLDRLRPFETNEDLAWWNMADPKTIQSIQQIPFAYGCIRK